ncbi:terminase small subunit [Paenibacillus sp. CMAA1739]|uniref:terminase small subunit n=1 Tax=Paenibacillus ottowii TaxID=2315729 RepID=UPI002DBB60B0|nr:terminase small subunit [Paenibacillus sp. CMAA1739]MEC4566759.1 terminase small subunit [Paenibacillus sp. CMAA1739]
MTEKKLTEKQKRFIDYFVETGNSTEAARRAGYKQPHVQGAQTLDKLRSLIDKKIAAKDGERIAKQDEILEFLSEVMRGKVKEEYPLGMGMGEQSLVKKELDGKDRIKAAELLGKRYAMWTDKQQVDGSVGVVIVDDLGDEDDSPQG